MSEIIVLIGRDKLSCDMLTNCRGCDAKRIKKEIREIRIIVIIIINTHLFYLLDRVSLYGELSRTFSKRPVYHEFITQITITS